MTDSSGMPSGILQDIGQSNFAKKKALRVASEIAKRRIEALNLYVPQPTQDDFHKCTAPECMLQGGNRGGKSLAAFIEDARAVLGKFLTTFTRMKARRMDIEIPAKNAGQR